MSKSIPIKDSDLTITTNPITCGVGSIEAQGVCTQLALNVDTLTNRFIQEAEAGDKVHVSITSNFGNEIRTTELVLETIPNDCSVVAEFGPLPKATVRTCRIETNAKPLATKIFDQLTSGFHFDVKLCNTEFEETEED